MSAPSMLITVQHCSYAPNIVGATREKFGMVLKAQGNGVIGESK
jgi:hypothetical protein